MTSEKIIFYPIGKDAFILIIVGKKLFILEQKKILFIYILMAVCELFNLMFFITLK